MSERSTVLGEYAAIKRDRERRDRGRKIAIVGAVVAVIAAIAIAGLVYYKNSTMSWTDEMWYQHAQELWPGQKDSVSYWSLSSSVFIEDNDSDYDNNCVESFHLYYTCSPVSYQIEMNSDRLHDRRVEYELAQNIEIISENNYFSLVVNGNDPGYLCRQKPPVADEWLNDYSLNNIFLPELESADDIAFSYRESNSNELFITLDENRIPANIRKAIIKDMFGSNSDADEVIIASCELSVRVTESEIKGWTISIQAADKNVGWVNYYRSYYMAKDDGFYYRVQDGVPVSSWDEVEEYRNITPVNYWQEIENGN